MSKPIIDVRGISKRYRLGAIGATRLRDDIERLWHSVTGKVGKVSKDEFWALRDVSFEVQPGEVVGIIGRNGAGKSTLLKILSRITEPTSGEVVMRGRVASLLEVGTGFVGDLSGRDNVYLNGAILGMTKAEIRSKFDEIVAFSEIEKFIDTPVKRYSSGMYVRLAFAVAAHLEPEILIIDEVLAVGDMQFQKKCIGKMDQVAKQGRTVLFVSHNTGVLANLCTEGVLLNKGQVICTGRVNEVVENYMSAGATGSGEMTWPHPSEAPGNEKVKLRAVRIYSGENVSLDVDIAQEVRMEMEYEILKDGLPAGASFHLLDNLGGVILATVNMPSANTARDEWFGRSFPRGVYRSTCTLPSNFLNEGSYSIRAAVMSNVSAIELLTEDLLRFTAHDTGEMRKEHSGKWIGAIRPKLAWQTKQVKVSNGAV